MEKRYLGDGVYASTDGYQVILTTSDGVHVTNVIYLDSSTMSALDKFYKDICQEAKEENEEESEEA